MSFKDWVSYLLERMVWFMETPREERKKARANRKEDWATRWFGLLPLSVKMAVDKQKFRLRSRS